MLSILISLLVSVIITGTLVATNTHTGTTIFFSIFSFIATFALLAFLTRKKIVAVQKELQDIMVKGQQQIQRKIQNFQMKPGGNIKLMQRQIEADQKAAYKKGLEFIPRLEPFKKWSILMGRQIATMRLQFSYQLQDFDEVDAILATRGLFKGPMMMEPMSVSMKMARQYRNKDVEGAKKTFKRHIKWFRGDRGTLIYGLMTWILIKEGNLDEARDLLKKAADATGHETFIQNGVHLANNSAKSFSNAGLGDEWYGLYLEKPVTPKPQRMRGNPNQARRF